MFAVRGYVGDGTAQRGAASLPSVTGYSPHLAALSVADQYSLFAVVRNGHQRVGDPDGTTRCRQQRYGNGYYYFSE